MSLILLVVVLLLLFGGGFGYHQGWHPGLYGGVPTIPLILIVVLLLTYR